jgi:ribosomal protein S6--L-glutamate ligase
VRLAILGRADSWHVGRLAFAGRELGAEVLVAPFERLVGSLSEDKAALRVGEVDLLSLDGVMVRGIPPGSLEKVVFRMDALHRLERAGVTVLNRPSAIETCVDKYLATSRLQSAGLPVPRTVVCESLDDAMQAFFDLGGRVVVKPIFGSEGRGVAEIADEANAYRVLRTLTTIDAVLYLQEFIPSGGWDVRAFLVGGRVVAAMKRTANDDFRANASRGARCEAFVMTPETERLALAAADAVGAPIAGVDLLQSNDGRWVVLEVNSTPGFQALEGCTGVRVAEAMMEFLVTPRRSPSTSKA